MFIIVFCLNSYLATSTAASVPFLFFINRYAIGDATNREDSVPNTTPRIMANAKLRMESPPRMKMHSNTIKVLSEVLMVRAKVVFNESLNNWNLSRFG